MGTKAKFPYRWAVGFPISHGAGGSCDHWLERGRIRSPAVPHTWQDLLVHSAATPRLVWSQEHQWWRAQTILECSKYLLSIPGNQASSLCALLQNEGVNGLQLLPLIIFIWILGPWMCCFLHWSQFELQKARSTAPQKGHGEGSVPPALTPAHKPALSFILPALSVLSATNSCRN